MLKLTTASLIFMYSFSSFAAESVEVSGELSASLRLYNLPSGQRGHSDFQLQTLWFNLDMPLQGLSHFHLQIEGTDERDSLVEINNFKQYQASGEFKFSVKEAYVDLFNSGSSVKALRLGLLPQVWQETQYQYKNMRYLGKIGWEFSEKFNYLAHSDLGLSYMSEIPSAQIDWAVSIYNGEGLEKTPTKAMKDFGIFFKFFKDSDFNIDLNLIYGHYDTYEMSTGAKERVLMALNHRIDERLFWRMALLYAQDPMEAFADFNIANKPNLDDYVAQKVAGAGATLEAIYGVREKWDVLVRYDYLMPAIKAKKALQSGIIGLSYEYSRDIRLAVAIDYTGYSSDYGKGIRDESKLTLASTVQF